MRKLFLSLILGISLLSCIHEESDIFQDETELSSSNFNSRFWSENIIIRGGNGNEKSFIDDVLYSIYEDPVGEYIINILYSTNKKIHFVINPMLPPNKMKASIKADGIEIQCNIQKTSGVSIYVALVFHELFHYCQPQGDKWELNNELEAYVALLRYTKRNPNIGFPYELYNVCNDVQTHWEKLDGTTRKQKKFNDAYEAALDVLRRYDDDYANAQEDYTHRHFGVLDRVEQDACGY